MDIRWFVFVLGVTQNDLGSKDLSPGTYSALHWTALSKHNALNNCNKLIVIHYTGRSRIFVHCQKKSLSDKMASLWSLFQFLSKFIPFKDKYILSPYRYFGSLSQNSNILSRLFEKIGNTLWNKKNSSNMYKPH